MNEKVDLWIQSINLHKDIIKVLAMLEGKSTPTKSGHSLLESWAHIVNVLFPLKAKVKENFYKMVEI